MAVDLFVRLSMKSRGTIWPTIAAGSGRAFMVEQSTPAWKSSRLLSRGEKPDMASLPTITNRNCETPYVQCPKSKRSFFSNGRSCQEVTRTST